MSVTDFRVRCHTNGENGSPTSQGISLEAKLVEVGAGDGGFRKCFRFLVHASEGTKNIGQYLRDMLIAP
jgi:hypothetical protein